MNQLIAITMGDPGGIGPEILVKALQKRKTRARYVVLGSRQALDLLKRKTKLCLPFHFIASRREIVQSAQPLLFWDQDAESPGAVQIGKINRVNGAKAFAAVRAAADLAKQKVADAVVTAPLHKTAVRLVSPQFVGHTEFLAQHAGVKKFAMMFVGSRFLVALATIHLPLKKVSAAITKPLVLEKIKLTAEFLKKYRYPNREVAVCALNPHGRETGDEEDRVLVPAIQAARRLGIRVSGPHSGDSAFYEAYRGAYGAVLAMYHDQALAPFKMVSFRDGVNVTLGLPYLRTSPDHGTAFDKAYRGVADESSFLSALDLALKLRRRP